MVDPTKYTEARIAYLEAAGVDNWEGYGNAMSILHGDEDDD